MQLAVWMSKYIFNRKVLSNAKKLISPGGISVSIENRQGDIWRLVMVQDLKIVFLSKEKLNQTEKGMRERYRLYLTSDISLLPPTPDTSLYHPPFMHTE